MKNKILVYVCGGLCFLALVAFVAQPVLGALGKKKKVQEDAPLVQPVITFNADSAYQFCADQCDFGARIMNSDAHDKCGAWIRAKFAQYGCTVESQKADLEGYDGTVLKSENIIARFNPEAQVRILVCAHWDSRPWADNDADEANHKTPVLAANDGASGVAVMLELARVFNEAKADTAILAQLPKLPEVGIDFVCFDAEDWGTPQWANVPDDSDSWALGAQHWANTFAAGSHDYNYSYGILLDMVGGEGAKFYEEYMSLQHASSIVSLVWASAEQIGYGSLFPKQNGGAITDDHIPVNEVAGIPCIDIIPYYPDCPQSSFGPTWHTVNDTMEHISRSTLKAVGQTMAYVLSGQ